MTGLEIVSKHVHEGEENGTVLVSIVQSLENARRRMACCLLNSVQARGGHQCELGGSRR
jgi:hypothetical protein